MPRNNLIGQPDDRFDPRSYATADVVRAVGCPLCRVGRGHSCRRKNGAPRVHNHLPRVRAYERLVGAV